MIKEGLCFDVDERSGWFTQVRFVAILLNLFQVVMPDAIGLFRAREFDVLYFDVAIFKDFLNLWGHGAVSIELDHHVVGYSSLIEPNFCVLWIGSAHTISHIFLLKKDNSYSID